MLGHGEAGAGNYPHQDWQLLILVSLVSILETHLWTHRLIHLQGKFQIHFNFSIKESSFVCLK